MPTGKYPRKPLRAIMRPLAEDDPRNIFTQARFREAWLNLAGAIGRVMADEDCEAAMKVRAKEVRREARKIENLKVTTLGRSLSPAAKKK